VERQRVLDTEDAARGPLSGITRLSDSPRVLKRIQEVELKGRRRKPTPPTTLSLNVTSATGQLTSPSQPRLPTGSGRVTGRQVSEEDEIAKIKKQNKSQEAAIATSSGSASAEVTSASHRKSDSSVPSTPTSAGERPRFSSSNSNDSKPAASRQTSTTSETTTRNRAENDSSSSTATPTGEEDGRVRKRSSYQSGNGAASKSGDVSLPESGSSGSRPTSFASNTSSPGDESSERAGRRVGRVSVDRFNKSASSESSTSAESSTHSSPVRNTGAAFSTGEIKSRFIGRKSSTGSNGETGKFNSALSYKIKKNALIFF
jgi:tripartite motif-containing protein 71